MTCRGWRGRLLCLLAGVLLLFRHAHAAPRLLINGVFRSEPQSGYTRDSSLRCDPSQTTAMQSVPWTAKAVSATSLTSAGVVYAEEKDQPALLAVSLDGSSQVTGVRVFRIASDGSAKEEAMPMLVEMLRGSRLKRWR